MNKNRSQKFLEKYPSVEVIGALNIPNVRFFVQYSNKEPGVLTLITHSEPHLIVAKIKSPTSRPNNIEVIKGHLSEKDYSAILNILRNESDETCGFEGWRYLLIANDYSNCIVEKRSENAIIRV